MIVQFRLPESRIVNKLSGRVVHKADNKGLGWLLYIENVLIGNVN